MFRSAIYFFILIWFFGASFCNASNYNYYTNQWYLYGGKINNQGGFGIGYDNYVLENIDEITEVVTVVISSGIDVNHEDLVQSLWINEHEIPGNGIDDDENGYIDDIHGVNPVHLNGDLSDELGFGTAMSGVIAATNDQNGINGISSNNKILGCNVYRNDGLYVHDFEKCVDYVIQQKNKLDLNIASVVIDWGAAAKKLGVVDPNVVYAYQLAKNAFKKLEENNILLITPAPYKTDHPIDGDLDFSLQFPYAYLMSNTVLVSGIAMNGHLPTSGGNSISTFAPSDFIFSTSNKKSLYPSSVDFEFEQEDIPSSNLSQVKIESGKYTTTGESWAFYGWDAKLALPQLDLSNIEETEFVITFDLLNDSAQSVYLEVMRNDGSWEIVSSTIHTSVSWYKYSKAFSLKGRENINLSDLKFRIKTTSNHLPDTALYIDNIKIFRRSQALEKSDYRIASGTFMAAAQVAGVAAIAKSANNLSMESIRNLIISSGVALQDVEHRSLSDKRLSIIGNNEGVLDCKDKVIKKRLYPHTERFIARVKGHEVIIKGININCDKSLGDMIIKDLTEGKEYVAKDDGEGLDEKANDGYNIASIKFNNVGKHELQVGTDETSIIYSMNPYSIYSNVGKLWLNMESLEYYLFDDFPFKLKLGGISEGIPVNYTNSSYNSISFFDDYQNQEQARLYGINNTQKNALQENSIKALPNELAEDTPQYDPDFALNGISNPWQEKISLTPFTFSTEAAEKLGASGLGITGNGFVTGLEGEKVVIFNKYFDPYDRHENFSGTIQVLLFEQSSTIVYNYKNLSSSIKEAIESFSMGIGSNYKIVKEFNLKDEGSYIFKENDGVNLEPNQISNSIYTYEKSTDSIYINELFKDDDGDVLFYKLSDNESFLKLNILGKLDIKYQESWTIGDVIPVNILVSDGEIELLKTVNIIIGNEPNRKPELNIDEITLYTSRETNINLNDYVLDEDDDEITISLVQPSRKFSIVNNILSGKVMKSDFNSDLNEILLQLDDSHEQIIHSLKIKIIYTNHPTEVAQSPSTIRFKVGEKKEINLLDYFYDIDEDKLNYNIKTDFKFSIRESNFITLEAEDKAVGKYRLVVTATDSESTPVEIEFNLSIEPENETIDGGSSSGGSINYIYYFILLIFSLHKRCRHVFRR